MSASVERAGEKKVRADPLVVWGALYSVAGDRVSDWVVATWGATFRFVTLQPMDLGAHIRVARIPDGETVLLVDVNTALSPLDEVSFDLRQVDW